MLSSFAAEQPIWSGSPLFSAVVFSISIGLVKAPKNNKIKSISKLNVSYLHIYRTSET